MERQKNPFRYVNVTFRMTAMSAEEGKGLGMVAMRAGG